MATPAHFCENAARMGLLPAVLLTTLLTATPQPVRLRWERAPGAEACPDQDALERAVTARLGRSPFDATATDALEARVEPSPIGGLVARVSRVDATGAVLGRRELTSTSRDCRELAQALELALVLAIDPARALARPPREPSPPEPPPAPSPPPPVPWELSLGLGPVGVVGAEAQPTVGLAAEVALRRGGVELDALGRVDAETGLATPPGHVSTQAIVGQLSPCLRLGRAGVCALATAGALRLSGEGFTTNTRQTAALVLVGIRGFVELHVGGPLFLRGQLAVEAALTRTSVSTDAQVLWVTPAVTATAGLTLLVRAL